MKMYKTITTIIITVIVVFFSLQNFEHVPVFFFWGKPINIRLIFVIATSGIIGYLIRHFAAIGREERLKRQLHYLLRKKAIRRKKAMTGFETELDEV